MIEIKKYKHSLELIRLIAPIALNKDTYKELGYPIFTDDSHTWYLAFSDGELIGFCAAINKGAYTSFNHDYVLTEHRKKGIYDMLFAFRMFNESGLIKAVATERSINTFLRNGFIIKKTTKNYYFVQYEKYN